MKTYIQNLIALLFPLTVNGVLARFERDVAKLVTLEANHRAAADSHEALAEEFYDLAADHHDEADRAAKVASRIADLIR
jgi:hypothetical protein